MLDHAAGYAAVHDRLAARLRGRDGHEEVPACPGWTARDVIAHLTGLCEDWVSGDLEGYASDAWTTAQIERSAGAMLDEILDRWQEALGAFASLPDDPAMGPPARWAFGDAVVHEADVYGALGGGRVPLDGVALSLSGQIARWRLALADAATTTLLVRCPELRSWWLGEHDDPEAVVLDAPAHEVFRALAGRRSREQVASWAWSGDPSPFLDAGLPYPFTWSRAPISD